MRRLITSSVLLLVLGACSAGQTSDRPASSLSTVGEPVGTSTPGSTGVPTTGRTPSTEPPGPMAPDFTIALGDGGTYTLSEGAKPVYLVFWAEW
jgi:hypothetical protein